MKILASLFALAFLAAASGAHAAAQQEKMKMCSAQAKDKALKGDERQAFMKECLSAKGEAPAAKAEAPAATPAAANSDCGAKAMEKKLAGAAKASFMKKCEADAMAAAKETPKEAAKPAPKEPPKAAK